MTTTEQKPLPVTMEILRAHWLPAEPDTSVSRTMDGIRRINALVDAVRSELADREQQDHQAVEELVTAAVDDHELGPHLGRLGPGDAPTLTHRVQLLEQARMVATHRHDRAQRTDEQYLTWRAACDEIAADWSRAMSGDTNARINALVEFAANH